MPHGAAPAPRWGSPAARAGRYRDREAAAVLTTGGLDHPLAVEAGVGALGERALGTCAADSEQPKAPTAPSPTRCRGGLSAVLGGQNLVYDRAARPQLRFLQRYRTLRLTPKEAITVALEQDAAAG